MARSAPSRRSAVSTSWGSGSADMTASHTDGTSVADSTASGSRAKASTASGAYMVRERRRTTSGTAVAPPVWRRIMTPSATCTARTEGGRASPARRVGPFPSHRSLNSRTSCWTCRSNPIRSASISATSHRATSCARILGAMAINRSTAGGKRVPGNSRARWRSILGNTWRGSARSRGAMAMFMTNSSPPIAAIWSESAVQPMCRSRART